MTNRDPQTTADFWDAYLLAADANTNLAQVTRAFSLAPHELCAPISRPVSSMPRNACAAIKFAWDLILLPASTAAGAPPTVA
jgi:hypothetical protein